MVIAIIFLLLLILLKMPKRQRATRAPDFSAKMNVVRVLGLLMFTLVVFILCTAKYN
jgi:predicted MFS family arabinose efflux permease